AIPGGTLPPPQNVYVVSVGTNGCDATSLPFPVQYGPVTPSGITANCWNYGVAGTTNITVANAPSPFYGNYVISSTPAGLITGSSVNPTTGVITVTTSGTAPAGTYTINVTHTTGAPCGNSPVASFPITYNGNGTILTTIYNPGVGGPDVYITSSAPVGATYAWYLNGSGPPAVPTGTGPVLYLTGSGPAPTSVCVYVTSGGCKTVLCASPPGTHNLAPGTSNPEESMAPSSKVEIYPNPNDGNFSVKVPAFKNEAIATIIDESGREIGHHRLKEGLNRISERDMPTGQYFLILNLDGVYSMHKLQVSQK
ncbi:T9SS type A sorting domain-containing protein, partial [Fluviicola sp.]|uniref:T9SS type A sorting domain-containing protein n=1 Tax=Fluviicola sp. TaxID=1917219 RepID=UPI00260A37AA